MIDYNGARSFLTASHCTWDVFATDGTYAHQAEPTGPRIGVEAYDSGWYYCNYLHKCRQSDAAIYSLYSPYSADQSKVGLIAKPTSSSGTWGTPGSTTWDSTSPYFIVTFASSGFAGGETVDKVGVVTGWTSGTITNTCVDKLMEDPTYQVNCSMETSMYVDNGDSGSPVFSAQTSTYDVDVNFAGIVWAFKSNPSRSYFSPLSRITNDFQSSMGVVRAATLSTPVVSGQVANGIPGISWSGATGATYYQVWRQWYRYPSGTGSNGWEYLGHLSSTFWDSQMSVDLYTGTTVPNFSTEGYVEYYVVAFNAADRSIQSTAKYFRLAPL